MLVPRARTVREPNRLEMGFLSFIPEVYYVNAIGCGGPLAPAVMCVHSRPTVTHSGPLGWGTGLELLFRDPAGECGLHD